MSLNITLPDGSVRHFDAPVTGLEIAQSIGSGLAKACIAIKVNGDYKDASDPITSDASIEIVTLKDEMGVHIMRHSCAHLFGHALKQLHPDAKMAIGPVIENGFYYDVDFALTEEDLPIIEARMLELARSKYPVVKKMTPRQDTIDTFSQRGEDYKLKLIADLSEESEFGLYHHQEYIDMCVGPHVPHMGFIKAFKLTRLAGAYWRGDSNNKMLQRVYGIAFTSDADLKAHLDFLLEADKRDHRKLGKNLQLFHVDDIAPGMVFWHHKGKVLFNLVQDYMRRQIVNNGYQEVQTPLIMDKSLWQKSGHWDKFKENMFMTETDNRDYAVKPMNCPGHINIYNQSLHSYRDLPLRIAEFGLVHRYEASGTLHGLLRVRSFTQDDAHIFCTPQQVKAEVKSCIELVYQTYKDFGFEGIEVKLSLRPEQRVGSDEIWNKAETGLAEALTELSIAYEVQPGEGAFYGPKIEFSLKDTLNRVWQCGTVQLDFSMPERLSAVYVDDNNDKVHPVMIHRAILGSLERFVGILTEHHEGKFPLWLAPVQIVLLGINQQQNDHISALTAQLVSEGIRAECDLKHEKLGYKIREHTLQRIPLIGVIGDKEIENNSINVRLLDGTTLGNMTPNALVAHIKKTN